MPSTSRRCQAKTSLRRKSAELQLALEGSVSTHQRAMLGRQLRHVEFLEQEIQELNVEIEERMRPFDAGIDLIDGIWGLGRRSAEAIQPSVIRRVTAGTERLTAMPVDRAATKWYYTNMRLMAAPKTAPALSYGSTGGYVPPSFASVEEGLAVIDRGGPENLTSDTLREDLKWFTIQQRTLEAMSARWLGELDRREQQASADDSRDDFFSCTRWLSETLKLTPNQAYAQVRTARMLEQLPWTAAAFRRGQISSQHVAVIRRAMEQVPKTCLDPSDVEPALVFAARQMDTFNLEQQWQQMRYQADQEAALEAEEERRRQRWLSLRQIPTGNYRIEGVLDAEGGATLKTAIRGLLGPRPANDDERTPAQRRADAVVELARHVLDAGDLPERGGEKPHLLLTADLSTLRLA